jgi:hypothetical protein
MTRSKLLPKNYLELTEKSQKVIGVSFSGGGAPRDRIMLESKDVKRSSCSFILSSFFSESLNA